MFADHIGFHYCFGMNSNDPNILVRTDVSCFGAGNKKTGNTLYSIVKKLLFIYILKCMFVGLSFSISPVGASASLSSSHEDMEELLEVIEVSKIKQNMVLLYSFVKLLATLT